MPRKAKAKGKSDSYRPTNFSTKNTSLLKVGYGSMLADGKLSRDNIIEMGSKTLFGQLKNDGFIKETSEKGVFKTTDKFQKQFSSLIGESKNFGGSTSGEVHQRLVSDIVSKIPESALLRNDFKNGNQLSTENRQNKKTPEFQSKLNELKQDVYAQQRANEQSRIDAERLSGTQKVQALINYQDKKSELEMREKVLNDNKRGISAPDFQFTLTKSEVNEFIDNLRELEQREEYYSQKEQWEESIARLQQYVMEQTTETVEIYTEVIDSNYRTRDILSKEYYSQVYNTPVFMFET